MSLLFYNIYSDLSLICLNIMIHRIRSFHLINLISTSIYITFTNFIDEYYVNLFMPRYKRIYFNFLEALIKIIVEFFRPSFISSNFFIITIPVILFNIFDFFNLTLHKPSVMTNFFEYLSKETI